MSTTRDLNILRYGTPDGHQATSQPLKSTVSVYIGQIALTRSGYLIQPDTSVTNADIAWGVINGQVNSQETVSSPITGGSTDGDHVVGIDTGTFWLSNGTSSDELTQADVGATVYAIDGNTAGKTNGGGSRPTLGKMAELGVAQYAGLVAVTIGNNQSSGSP